MVLTAPLIPGRDDNPKSGGEANLRPEMADVGPRGRKLVLAWVAIAACDHK